MPRRKRTRSGKRRKRRSSAGKSVFSTKHYIKGIIQVQPSATTSNWTFTSYIFPLLNIPAPAGKARVVEFLKVKIGSTGAYNASNIVGFSSFIPGANTSITPTQTYMADKRNIFVANLNFSQASSFTEIDLTDDNGNGILYPNSSFNFVTDGDGSGSYYTNAEFYYRYREVGLADYIEIMNTYQTV